jgi:aryl-alcohol dehydrogenase-like predicted oxidoreductase
MKYRTFGKTGWKVSEVGMGCWAFGGKWGPLDSLQAAATVHAALESGINLFDTSDSYGPRRSEDFLGKALVGQRHDVFIATKVGSIGGQDGEPLNFATPEHVFLCCDASLHRLRTDYIDLYQCHSRRHANKEVIVEAMERLRERGKIRSYGVSSFFTDDVQIFDEHGHCEVVQVPYSVVERDYEDDVLAMCAERNIGTLVRGPLTQGVLSGKFSKETQFDDEARIEWNSGEGRRKFLQMVESAEMLRPLVNASRSMAQISLAFTLANPAVSCVIPGAKTPEQARANAAASDIELTEAEINQIRAITPPAG